MRTQSCQGLGLGLPCFYNCKKYVSVFVSYPICGIQLQQPGHTKTFRLLSVCDPWFLTSLIIHPSQTNFLSFSHSVVISKLCNKSLTPGLSFPSQTHLIILCVGNVGRAQLGGSSVLQCCQKLPVCVKADLDLAPLHPLGKAVTANLCEGSKKETQLLGGRLSVILNPPQNQTGLTEVAAGLAGIMPFPQICSSLLFLPFPAFISLLDYLQLSHMVP